MIYNKLLSIKKDKNIILYNMYIDSSRIDYLADRLNILFGKKENVITTCTFDGLTPISYGRFDKLGDLCSFKDLGVYDTKKERLSENYKSSFAYLSREWDFLSDEEKKEAELLKGVHEAKVKLEVTYIPVISKLLKETFTSDSKNPCIDLTGLIKYFNHMLKKKSNLTFDKMLDLNKKGLKWNDKRKAFLSIEDYNNYLRNADKYLNIDDVITTKKEEEIAEITFELFDEIRRCFGVEQIGMFPIDIELSKDLEILKRYAIRNESFTYLNSSLENSSVNYDGGKVLGEMRNSIIENNDLDGVNTEKEILSKISENEKVLSKLTSKCKEDSNEGLIKINKAA